MIFSAFDVIIRKVYSVFSFSQYVGVTSPSKLSLDRQFTNSALISWRGAELPSDEIQGYNIYVDGQFKTQVKGSKKTNVVVEDIKPTQVGFVRQNRSVVFITLLS